MSRVVLIAVLLLRLNAGANEPGAPDVAVSARAVDGLVQWLDEPLDRRATLEKTDFASIPLTKPDAARAQRLLWDAHAAAIRAERTAEMSAKIIDLNDRKMKFETLSFGDQDHPPTGGRSLFISMHGGGGAPPTVNESQWQNQVRLGNAYHPAEGIYLAPRAPTDTWNLWHEAHIDSFFDRLIENLIVLGGVNPNRVYILGYSAGGDGVYQLGPRMADRWAAAAMMAGHPNDASPLGLRNIGFAIQVGANDGAYDRSKVAAEWGRKLDELQKADPNGYAHFTELHEGKGHWMDLEDRKAIPWMEKFTRNPLPAKIAWHQSGVVHSSFYWLAVPPDEAHVGDEITAQREAQTITIASEKATSVIVHLNDAMLDLDRPVRVLWNSREVFAAVVPRTISTLAATLATRGDPELVFSAELRLRQ